MSYLFVLIIVSLLVFVHELGHFLVARVVGLPISRFSVGMGPALWSFRSGATEYRLSWIPFGGYVLPAASDAREFFELPVAKRLLFALGGPIANLGLAALGFAAFNVAMYGWSFEAIVSAPIPQTMMAVKAVVRAVPQLFSSAHDVSGIVGVVAQGGEFVGLSGMLALQFAIVMSINLAILNMIPVPPLDGGKALLCLLETIHEGAHRLHVPLNVAGFVALMGYIGYATILDVKRLVDGLLA